MEAGREPHAYRMLEAIMPELFDPAARKVYEAILAATAKFGEVRVEEKKA
jgi:hypothetical protein